MLRKSPPRYNNPNKTPVIPTSDVVISSLPVHPTAALTALKVQTIKWVLLSHTSKIHPHYLRWMSAAWNQFQIG